MADTTELTLNDLHQTFTDDVGWLVAREMTDSHGTIIRFLLGTYPKGYTTMNLNDEQARELLLTLANAINASRAREAAV